MKKLSKILIIVAIVAMGAGVAGVVLAVETLDLSKKSPVQGIQDILNILNNIVVVMYRAFFIVAIGVVIWAAFTYLKGGNDPEKIKSATKQLLWAAVAIIIALASVGANAIINTFIRGQW